MNIKDIKVVDKNIDFNKVVEYIQFVISKSFGEDGLYHRYLRDFAEASAIISMYTDYDNTEFDINEIMEYIHSDEWRILKQQLGQKYDTFDRYVEFEINNINTPLRFADNAIKVLTVAMSKVNQILGAIDVEQLKNYDFTKIANAIDAVNEAKESINE